jgi:hypothetical protein
MLTGQRLSQTQPRFQTDAQTHNQLLVGSLKHSRKPGFAMRRLLAGSCAKHPHVLPVILGLMVVQPDKT